MINIGFAGQVSTGKTTAINAILADYLGETKLKRATMKTCIFNHDDSVNNNEKIKDTIERINQGENLSTEFNVNIPFENKPDLNFSIIDFPGFNDGNEGDFGMEKLFLEKLPELNYIIYIVDSEQALVHKSEQTLIEKIFDKIIDNHTINYKYTKVLFVFNKYEYDDDDEDSEDNEVKEIVEDAEKKLMTLAYNKGFPLEAIQFYKVSFRRIMVKRILAETTNKTKALRKIPNNVLGGILSEYFGKITAKQIIKKGTIKKKQIKEIKLTGEELNFMKNIYKMTSKKENVEWSSYILKKTINNTNSIQSRCNQLMNNKILSEWDHDVYDDIVYEYLICPNNEKIKECINSHSIDHSYLIYLFEMNELLYSLTKNKFSQNTILNELLIDLLKCNNLILQHYTLKLCVKYNIYNYLKYFKLSNYDLKKNISYIVKKPTSIYDISYNHANESTCYISKYFIDKDLWCNIIHNNEDKYIKQFIKHIDYLIFEAIDENMLYYWINCSIIGKRVLYNVCCMNNNDIDNTYYKFIALERKIMVENKINNSKNLGLMENTEFNDIDANLLSYYGDTSLKYDDKPWKNNKRAYKFINYYPQILINTMISDAMIELISSKNENNFDNIIENDSKKIDNNKSPIIKSSPIKNNEEHKMVYVSDSDDEDDNNEYDESDSEYEIDFPKERNDMKIKTN